MDLDDLDSLLELEEELLEEEGSHKRSLADLQSQGEAARILAGPPEGKRARLENQPAPGYDLDDEALVALACSQPTQTQGAATYQGMGPSEAQALLALAADSQPSGHPGGPSRRTHTAAAAASLLADTEDQALLELAADTQPSPVPAAARGGDSSVAAQRRAASGGAAAPRAGQADDDFDLDAMLNEILEEELAEAGAGAAGGGAAAGQPAAAAAQQAAGPAAGRGAAEAAAGAAELLLPARHYVPPARDVYRIDGPSLPITSESGERVYCWVEAPHSAGAAGGRSTRRADVAAMLRRARGRLLSQPISALLAALERDRYERAVAETAAAAKAPGGGRRRRSGGGAAAAGEGGGSLWVQKYAAKAYIDLLSDEQINREVVRWLKGWDPCVFGTPAPAPPPQKAHAHPSRLAAHGGGPQQPAGGGTDALGRPEQRVILIAGPPGLGKTTLAHVCAAHCGYRPVEVNASDDRGGASLHARVADAVEMQSVMDRQRRPNCVIIDEIDGASGGAEGRSGIAALLKIVNATAGKPGKQAGGGKGRGEAVDAGQDSDSDGEEEGGAAGAGTRTAVARRNDAALAGRARQPRLRPLMRPIICICNDLYSPALRPLRDVARVFHFKRPQAERLTQRLQAVCAAEGLACEKSTLRLLAERAECDIRSCLNTLQFLSKKQATVRASDLAGLSMGQKDMTKGAFAVWTELLQKRKSPGIIGKAAENEAQRAARLYDLLQDFGEGELVMGGVHENVLGLRYFDMALQRTSAVLNHLGDSDAFLRACHTTSDFSLLKYVPAPLVLVSGIVAGPDRPQLQWPRAAFETKRRAAANAALLQGWMLGMPPATCAGTSRRSLLLEVLPSLMHIAAPSLRPVSQHLYSPIEQETVRQLVDTLLSYNLRYCLDASAEEAEEEEVAAARQREGGGEPEAAGVRGAHAQPPLRFRPAVHRACHFPGAAPKGKLLPAAVRQTVSHEADMEAIRRADGARRGTSAAAGPAGEAAGPPAPLRSANGAPRAPPPAGPVPLTLAERMKAAGTAASAVQRQAARKGTWLDQLKERRQAAGSAAGADGSGTVGGGRSNKFPVLYKFHEGYTNAVKRPLLMRDLLP